MIKLDITKEGVTVYRKFKRAAKRTAKSAAQLEGKKGRISVSLLFTDSDNIRRLNKQYRGKDEETDVLSFPSEEKEFLGDIAVCLPKAQQQAAEVCQSTEREIAFLVAHSMLHLFGYDHGTEKEAEKMREKERQILNKTGYKR